MTAHVREGELQFEFLGATSVERLDVQGQPRPHGMALVDFVVEENSRTLLIEIKDPSQQPVPERERQRFIRAMQHQTLIYEDLVPKARDSYTFLHLMERATHPCIYVVVLGLDRLAVDPALLSNFKDRLLQRIRHEAQDPWQRHYVIDCAVVIPATWSTHFPAYALSRSAHS
jgi:hypothetical protein